MVSTQKVAGSTATAVVPLGCLDGYEAVADILRHQRRIALERVTPAAASSGVVGENLSGFEEVVAAPLTLLVGVLQVAPGRAHIQVVRRDLGGGQLAERVEDVRAVLSDRRAVGDVDGHRNPRGTEQCQVREK